MKNSCKKPHKRIKSDDRISVLNDYQSIPEIVEQLHLLGKSVIGAESISKKRPKDLNENLEKISFWLFIIVSPTWKWND